LGGNPNAPGANDPGKPGALGPDFHLPAARLWEERGNTVDAAKHYRMALQGDPENLMALLGYARLLHREGHLKEAVDLCRQAVRAHPRNAIAWNDLGLCHARRHESEHAIAALAFAIELQPLRKLYRNNIAAVLVEANRPDEALTHLALVHDEAVARYNLGYLLHRHGDNEPAVEQLVRALRLDPSLSQAQHTLAKMGYQAPNHTLDPTPVPTRSVGMVPQSSQDSGFHASASDQGPPPRLYRPGSTAMRASLSDRSAATEDYRGLRMPTWTPPATEMAPPTPPPTPEHVGRLGIPRPDAPHVLPPIGSTEH